MNDSQFVVGTSIKACDDFKMQPRRFASFLLRSHVGASGIADENLKDFFTRRQRMKRWKWWTLTNVWRGLFIFLFFTSHRWDMMKMKRLQDEARVGNIFKIYCSVKFHQMAINQKLNLSEDDLYCQPRTASQKRAAQTKNHLKVIKMKKDGREIYRQSLDVFSFRRVWKVNLAVSRESFVVKHLLWNQSNLIFCTVLTTRPTFVYKFSSIPLCTNIRLYFHTTRTNISQRKRVHF